MGEDFRWLPGSNSNHSAGFRMKSARAGVFARWRLVQKGVASPFTGLQKNAPPREAADPEGEETSRGRLRESWTFTAAASRRVLGMGIGASAKEAQELAMHSKPSLTFNTYGRARTERLAEIAEVIGKTLGGANTTEAQRKKRRTRSRGIPKVWMVEAAGVEPGSGRVQPRASPRLSGS